MKTRQVAALLATKRPRRAAFLSKNQAELIPTFAAFATLNVSFTGIDYTAPLERNLRSLQTIEADTLIYSAEFENAARWIAARRKLDAYCLEEAFYNLPMDPGRAPAPMPGAFESISFTSGTTGSPKAVYRCTSFDAKRIADTSRMFNHGSELVFLMAVPLFHASATSWSRYVMSLGGTLVLADVHSPAAVAEDLTSDEVNSFLAPPPILAWIPIAPFRPNKGRLENCEFVGKSGVLRVDLVGLFLF